MIPTTRLALAVIGAAAVLLALGTLVGVIALAVVAAGYIVDVMRLRGGASVTRNLPANMQRLHPAALTLAATDSAAGHVELRQPSIPDIEIAQQTGRTGLETSIVAMRRGHHTIPPVAVRSVGPLGLAARQQELAGQHDVTVYPDVLGARRIARAVATGAFSSEGWRRKGPIGIGTEFETIREYTPDDDIRHVNWRATLRTGRPMTNTYRIDRDRDVMCVIDCGRLMTSPIGPHTRLDVAVDASTAIAHTADALGDRCGVVAFADRLLRSLPPSRRGADAVVEAIHDLEPVAIESNYEVAFRAVGRSKRSLVILFTDLFEESAAMPLLEALPALSRRHAVVVAYVRDDDLRKAVASPEAAEAPYRSVVALDALQTRRTAVARLRHRGVTVIEASADELPAAAVAAYLNLKQRAVV
ncbi:MAG: DUF58 domain-containing protein [Acidimicrobiia bacterium]|nr:DUF58 domain-containing protein [Acidimicrobiia bacterium]